MLLLVVPEVVASPVVEAVQYHQRPVVKSKSDRYRVPLVDTNLQFLVEVIQFI